MKNTLKLIAVATLLAGINLNAQTNRWQAEVADIHTANVTYVYITNHFGSSVYITTNVCSSIPSQSSNLATNVITINGKPIEVVFSNSNDDAAGERVRIAKYWENQTPWWVGANQMANMNAAQNWTMAAQQASWANQPTVKHLANNRVTITDPNAISISSTSWTDSNGNFQDRAVIH